MSYVVKWEPLSLRTVPPRGRDRDCSSIHTRTANCATATLWHPRVTERRTTGRTSSTILAIIGPPVKRGTYCAGYRDMLPEEPRPPNRISGAQEPASTPRELRKQARRCFKQAARASNKPLRNGLLARGEELLRQADKIEAPADPMAYVVIWVPAGGRNPRKSPTAFPTPSEAVDFACTVLRQRPENIWIEGPSGLRMDRDVIVRNCKALRPV